MKTRKPIFKTILAAILLALVCTGVYLYGILRADDVLTVRFLDVGQADAILISLNGEHVLIDGGNRKDSSLVYTRLKEEEIGRLKAVINTHPDEDHIGGLTAAFTACEVSSVYCCVSEYENDIWFSDYKDAAEKNGTPITIPHAGDTIGLSGAYLTFLSNPEKGSDINERSLVIRLDFGETSFLFAADAGTESEETLVESGAVLKADVLKVGHHGSSGSSSLAFLHEVCPDYAVISCGKNNTYGFPREETLERLDEAGSRILRTDLMGEIDFESDGKTVTYTSEKKYDHARSLTAPSGNGSDETAQYTNAAYIGNTKSKKFHKPSCTSLPDIEYRSYFADRNSAVSAGYTPCGRCDP